MLSGWTAPSRDSILSFSAGRLSTGRKTPPSVSAPSTGLRPLNFSRIKCGCVPCRGHSVLPCMGNTICLHCAFMKGARFDICLRKHVVADTKLMRTPKSANGPRSNSFRPDSPSTTNLPRGRKTQPAPLTTPDMVRSGRVLQTSVKSPFFSRYSCISSNSML